MRLDKISKYPEILLFIPALLIGAGYFIIQWGTSKENSQIILIGYLLISIGLLSLPFIGFIIFYVRFLKKQVEYKIKKKVEDNVWNLFMVSYIAGIYGGLVTIAANNILSTNDIYSKIITIITLLFMIIGGGIFGIVALTYTLKTKNESNQYRTLLKRKAKLSRKAYAFKVRNFKLHEK